LQLSAATGFGVTQVSAPLPRHCSVPLRQMPLLLSTMHGASRLTTSSETPLQLSSAPSFAQVSVLGTTAPVQVPSNPFVQLCMPALHLPTFSVVLGAG
jgi:hypothetical protein